MYRPTAGLVAPMDFIPMAFLAVPVAFVILLLGNLGCLEQKHSEWLCLSVNVRRGSYLNRDESATGDDDLHKGLGARAQASGDGSRSEPAKPRPAEHPEPLATKDWAAGHFRYRGAE